MDDVVITIFRSRLREGVGPDYAVWAARMEELASTMPGFVSFKTYRADDGDRVSIIEFASAEAAAAWARHPAHVEAQKLGRSTFYETFDVLTCTPLHRSSFARNDAE